MPGSTGDRFQDLFKDFNGNIVTLNNFGSLYRIQNNQPQIIPGNTSTIPGYIIFQGNIPDCNKFYELQDLQRGKFGRSYYQTTQIIIPLSADEYLINGRSGCFYHYKNSSFIDSLCFDLQGPYDYTMSGKFVYLKNRAGKLYRFNPADGKTSEVTFIPNDNNAELLGKQSKFLWNYSSSTSFIKNGNSLYELGTSVTGDTVYCKFLFNNLPPNCIITSALYHKQTKSYLVGTDTKGLLVYSQKNVINLPVNDINVPSSSYYGQAAIDSNRIFASYGLILSKDTTIQTGITGYNAESMHHARNGKLYYTFGDSLYYLDKKFQSHHLKGMRGMISCYLEDESEDKIYIGSRAGMGYLQNDTLKLVNSLNELNYDERPIQMLKLGNQFYVGTCSGLLKFDKEFKKCDTIPELKGLCVRSLFNYNEFIFAGTYGNGYYVIKGNKIQQMPLDREGRLSQVHSFYVDRSGYLWMSTNNGLLLTRISSVIDYFEQQKHPLFYYLINQEDGISNPEFNGGCSPSVLRLQNGFLSYPSLGGIVWINPDSVNLVFPTPKIFFENIKGDSLDIISVEPLRLKPGFQNLSIDLIVPYWGKPENLHLEYRLNPTDNWITVGPNEKRLRFGNLSSGRYNLEVRVRYGFGENDYYYRQLPFTVNEFLYEKTWVQVLAALIFATLIVLGFRIYNQSILRKNQLLEKSVQDRTTQLKESNELLRENLVKLQESEEELSKALNLRDKLMSIISHDLVTPIRYISISSRLARSESGPSPREELFQVLAEIEATTMRIYDNANNVLHWIRFQSTGMSIMKSNVAIHDLLNEVTTLYKPIADAGHTIISNNTPEEDIIISDPRILKIVFQNIVNNAVKFTKSGCITISSVTNGRDYRIMVSDTGPGFSEAALESIRQVKSGNEVDRFTSDLSEDGTHLGYQIIYELLRFLQGDFIIESTQDGSTVEVILYNCLLEAD